MTQENLTRKLYRVEVGVLLNKNNDEFEDYACVYDKKRGYYNEATCWYLDSARAAEFALSYVIKGVKNTYAIVKEITYDPKAIYGEDWYKYVEEDLRQIQEEYMLWEEDYFGDELWNTKNIVLDIRKTGEKNIKFGFVERESIA